MRDMIKCLLLVIALTTTAEVVVAQSNVTRNAKGLSMFQVVKFPNSICSGSTAYNGTCYSSTECQARGGNYSGSCANGFGVCCIFSLGCGEESYQNYTYFQSSSDSQSSSFCGVTVCKSSGDICQLRLDFLTFVISGPSTVTDSSAFIVGGSIATTAGSKVSFATRCLTDRFAVTGPVGGVLPVICGTNSGQHVYVDASDSCNKLDFQFGSNGIGTPTVERAWNIKILQVSCHDSNPVPQGCTQYYFGDLSGTIQSFNYDNKIQLADQTQNICFRRERNYCKLCFSAASANDFAVSGLLNELKGFTKGSNCCGYGSQGTESFGYDCVMIHGASVDNAPVPVSICGNGAGLVTKNSKKMDEAGARKTICTMQSPFQISFLTDGWTFSEGSSAFSGFKLDYWQTKC